MGTDPGPVTGPAPGPGPDLTVTQAAAVAGVTEKTIRNWIKAGHIPVALHPEGRRIAREGLLEYLRTRAVHVIEHLPPEARPETGPVASPVTGPDQSSKSGAGSDSFPEPIEARFRVTPAEIERAVERTGARYLADMETILTRVGQVYEGQLAAKDETIATQQETIAELRRQRDEDREREREALAELRRRAEVAEAEAEGLRLRLAEASVPPLVVVAGSEATEAVHTPGTTFEAHRPVQGLWRRLRRIVSRE